MIFSQGMLQPTLPRLVARSLEERLRIMPAVVVTGARQSGKSEILHWRTSIGEEVDFVIEAGDRLLPVEVKATGRPCLRDARHLFAFRREYGGRARAGLLIYTGPALEWLTSDVLAAPWWKVL